jgi:hypothetical protein
MDEWEEVKRTARAGLKLRQGLHEVTGKLLRKHGAREYWPWVVQKKVNELEVAIRSHNTLLVELAEAVAHQEELEGTHGHPALS